MPIVFTFRHIYYDSGGVAITNPPQDQNRKEGDVASFVCEGVHLDTPNGTLSVSWYKNKTPVEFESNLKGRVNVNTKGNLTINPVKPQDAGTYICEITNGIGRPKQVSANLEVFCKLNTLCFLVRNKFHKK